MSVSKTNFPCLFPDCSYEGVPTAVRKHLHKYHKSDEETVARFNAKVQATKAHQKNTELYDCLVCEQKFTSKGSIQNHVRTKHPSSTETTGGPIEPENKKFRICTEEVETFVTKSSINKMKPSNNQKLLCTHPDCSKDEDVQTYYGSRAEMCRHYKSDHKTEHEVEEKKFETESEFQAWLSKRQEETGTSLIIQKTVTEGKRTIIHMKCKHEGKYERTGSTRYGHDSKKCTGDHLCTSYLKAIKNAETIEVEACFTHYFHDITVAELSLTTSQKEKIVELVSKGFSNKTIVDLTKKESDEYSRMHFLNSDDIRNLKQSLDLNKEQLDRDDLLSVQKRVELKNIEDGFRLYVPPSDSEGTDFVIVIINNQHLESLKNFSHKIVILDDTHNVTQYGLKLTTLTVVDNYDRSEPAGFLISSSTTSKEVSMFFECIKKIYPDFHPTYFMTDEALCFWNGYIAVFTNSKSQRVVCRWHTYRAWKKNAKKYLKESFLSSTLQSLRELIRDPNRDRVLHRMLSLLTTLDNEGSREAKEFANYFRTYYYEKVDEWSASSRSLIACHTSMYAEAWHSVLKKTVIVTKRSIRLDLLISHLFTASKWVLQSKHDQKVRKLYAACPRKGQNRSKCREYTRTSSKYTISKNDDGTYTVIKKDDRGSVSREYTVIDFGDCFCDRIENTHCNYCTACAYRYWCDCLTSLAGVACKHIHGVLLHSEGSQIVEATDDSLAPRHCPESPPPYVAPESFEKLVEKARHNKEDEITKRMDNVKNMFSSIYAELRKKRRNSDVDFELQLEQAENALRALLNTTVTPGLVRRADADEPSRTARETMHSVSLKKRQRKKRTELTHSSVSLVPKRNITRCSICAEEHPPLPDDIDEDEYESRVTDWKRCTLCKQPAHFSCTLGNKKCICSPLSAFELYPDDYLQEIDSDEPSDN